jgi:hypothetical protein
MTYKLAYDAFRNYLGYTDASLSFDKLPQFKKCAWMHACIDPNLTATSLYSRYCAALHAQEELSLEDTLEFSECPIDIINAIILACQAVRKYRDARKMKFRQSNTVLYKNDDD